MPDLNGNLRNILFRKSKFPSCSDPLFIFSLSLGLISVNILLARDKLLKLTQVFTIFKVINMARLREKMFFWAQNIFLLTWNSFFVQHQLFFCWHEILFRATSISSCRHQITFCVTSNFLFRQEIVFGATPSFCFGHRLEGYIIVIYFYCHVATKM